jgi:tRNA pseudouridine38-40 synthase
MKKNKYYYLIKLQYLGFRYRGWFWQKNVKTVQEMIQKTTQFVLQHDRFKTLGAGRTDAMVSANLYAYELFMSEPLEDLESFMESFNINLPFDIRMLSIKEVDKQFNIMLDVAEKEYRYLFSFGEKYHPFAAPYMAFERQNLDIDLMIEGAKVFEGEHDFRKYCSQPTEFKQFVRTISHCSITENTYLQANFFPEKSYMLTIRSKGFLRYQIRFIMGALIRLGKHECTIDDIKESLLGKDKEKFYYPAPASGLMLYDLTYNHEIDEKE